MPATQTKENPPVELLKLEPNLVLLFSIIAVPVIILGSLLILGTVRAEMNQLVGEDMLGGAAADTARHLDSYLLESLRTVSIVATSPALHEAATASNARYREDPEAIERRLVDLDDDWVLSRGAVPLALDIVGNPASRHLRRIAELHPSYKEILVTDRFGALVAATNISTDYYQADEAWWRDAFGDGSSGSLHFADVRFDRSAGAYTLELAVPLRQEHEDGATEVAGVLKVLIGADELFSVVGSVRRGDSGHALLVDSEDGTVIIGVGTNDIMQRQYSGLVQLRESLREGRRSFLGRWGEQVWLAGFARMPQPSLASYGNWLVVVQQLHDEINAPTRKATLYLVAFFVGMVLLVVLFSLYLHYKLVRPIREIDLREEMDRLTAESAGSR